MTCGLLRSRYVGAFGGGEKKKRGGERERDSEKERDKEREVEKVRKCGLSRKYPVANLTSSTAELQPASASTNPCLLILCSINRRVASKATTVTPHSKNSKRVRDARDDR